MQAEELSQIDQKTVVDFLTQPLVAWFILGCFLLAFSIISIVLVYHWNRYGTGSKHIAFAEIVYFPVAFVLIGLISFALIMYGQS